MKVLVVKCHYVEGLGDADYALIEADEPLLAEIKAKLKFVQELKAKDDQLVSIDYRDWSPSFVAESSLTELETKGLKRDKKGDWSDDWVVVELPCEDLDTFLVNVSITTERMESCHLTVIDDSFWWGAYPKYVSEQVTTHMVSEKDLDLILKSLA